MTWFDFIAASLALTAFSLNEIDNHPVRLMNAKRKAMAFVLYFALAPWFMWLRWINARYLFTDITALWVAWAIYLQHSGA